MKTKLQESQQTTQGKQDRERLEGLVGKAVLRTLGQPTGLQRVQVRELWDNHYRVNILIGADASSVRVAHSYFLLSDSEGNVVESTPSIKKLYGPSSPVAG